MHIGPSQLGGQALSHLSSRRTVVVAEVSASYLGMKHALIGARLKGFAV